MQDITKILSEISTDDPKAADKILPLVYDELRRLATHRLASESPGQTLQATALVHEAYMRLVGNPEETWTGRGHFFGAAAEAMRRILVENARRKKAVKRGGGRQPISLRDADAVATDYEDLLDLDSALDKLEQHEPLAANIVKLRYFAGLTMKQTAEALNLPLRTAERNWTYAKSWLHAELIDD